nr:helix-turn-helix transcriptional regulator [uncultured Draconibacterium sp.]
MTNIEFYLTPKGDVMLHTSNGVKKLEPSNREFVRWMMDRIEELYPEALKAMSAHYSKLMAFPAQHEFMMVRRFIKCNWGKYDSVMDIDHFSNFNFEEVDCPMRGECPLEDIVCKPKFNSNLSYRELEVMHLYYLGHVTEAIAEKLFISVKTARTHKKNAFQKVGVHSIQEFFSYAKQNNLFEN